MFIWFTLNLLKIVIIIKVFIQYVKFGIWLLLMRDLLCYVKLYFKIKIGTDLTFRQFTRLQWFMHLCNVYDKIILFGRSSWRQQITAFFNNKHFTLVAEEVFVDKYLYDPFLYGINKKYPRVILKVKTNYFTNFVVFSFLYDVIRPQNQFFGEMLSNHSYER